MRKWKTILALGLIAGAVVFNWHWLWVVFILLGIIDVLTREEIHFVEEVRKAEDPILYWVVLLVWLFFAFYSLSNYIS